MEEQLDDICYSGYILERRRQAKDDKGLQSIFQRMRNKIKAAKKNWMREKCEGIDKLKRKEVIFLMQKRGKELVGTYTKR